MTFPQSTCDCYQQNEVADAARRLFSSYHGLIFRDIPDNLSTESPHELRVDLRPSLPRRRVKLFLSALEDIAQTLKVEMASRKYRLTFTKNYRSLMPADRRAYRLDVLEAAQDGHNALWVNGKKYDLRHDVLHEKERFRVAWFGLLDTLRKVQIDLDAGSNQRHECSRCTSQRLLENASPPSDRALRGFELCQFCSVDWLDKLGLVLIKFDLVWCCFERNYINELIDIERQSKKLIMDCVYIDEELRHYERLFSKIIMSSNYEKFQADAKSHLTNLHSSAGPTPFATSASQSPLASPSRRQVSHNAHDTTQLFLPLKSDAAKMSTMSCNLVNSKSFMSNQGHAPYCFPDNPLTATSQLHLLPPSQASQDFHTNNTNVQSESYPKAPTKIQTSETIRQPSSSLYKVNNDSSDIGQSAKFRAENKMHSEITNPFENQHICIVSRNTELFAQIRKAYSKLIAAVATLNVSANARRKGRGDYTLSLFECAMCIQHRLLSNCSNPVLFNWVLKELILCQDPDSKAAEWVYTLSAEQLRGLEILVIPLIENLRALRAYLQHIGELPERIDPHLCQNHELVTHLTHLEATWDVAKLHIENKDSVLRLTCFLNFVSEIIEQDVTSMNLKHLNKSYESNSSDDEMSNLISDPNYDRTPSPSMKLLRSTKRKRESLEEMIATCDVAAFLAIPKLAILYYFLNPSTNSVNSRLLQFLLPSVFEENMKRMNEVTANAQFTEKITSKRASPRGQQSQGYQETPAQQRPYLYCLENPIQKLQRTGLSSPHCYDADKKCCRTSTPEIQLPKHHNLHCVTTNLLREFFRSMRHLHVASDLNYIPKCFHRVIHEGAQVVFKLDAFLSNARLQFTDFASDCENAVWLCLIDHCISTSEYISYEFIAELKPYLDSFNLAIEEASMMLQRTNPTEWNSFLQITMKCLELVRRDDNSMNSPKNQLLAAILSTQNSGSTNTETMVSHTPASESEFATSPQSARLFQSSPITTRSSDH